MRLALTIAVLSIVLFAPSSSDAQPTSSFDDLAQRVRSGRRVQVEDRAGAKATGRLVALTSDHIVITTRQGERRFPRNEVAAVSLRGNYVRWATLLGAGIGAALCIPCTTGEHADRDAPVLTGLLGAGAGAIAGALIPRTAVLYRAADGPAVTSFAIGPTAARGAVGVRAILRW
jgi:hypothetical protein